MECCQDWKRMQAWEHRQYERERGSTAPERRGEGAQTLHSSSVDRRGQGRGNLLETQQMGLPLRLRRQE